MMKVSGTPDSSMEDQVMSAAKMFVGLCVTCNNLGSCEYRKRRGRDAICCELYDGFAVPTADRTAKATSVVSDATSTPDSIEFTGLCVNCHHRHDCELSKTQGGIWHCEEYE